MNIRLKFVLLFLILLCCVSKYQNAFAQPTIKDKSPIDTIIGRKIITDEIAGSAYRKKAIGYFIITGKDTCNYTCVFTQLKDGGKVCIDMNIPYYKDSIVYRKRMSILKKILPIAEKEFNFDSITSIYMGRLIQNGDLAIKITNQYKQKFKTTSRIKTSDYPKVAKFLEQSQLRTDLNEIFKPYLIQSHYVYPEHIFFTTKKELCHMSNLETNITNVSDRILDCMVVIGLKRDK